MTEAETIAGTIGTREVEEEQDDGNIRPGLDPFVQPTILKAFFGVLPMAELANCRLVSTLWHDESLPIWRSNATVRFEGEGIVSTREDGTRRGASFGEFLDLWNAGDWGSCPFKKFRFHSWNFLPADEEQDRFMEAVGGHITSLTLEKCSFIGRENSRRIMYQAFPKLQFLKMVSCQIDSAYYRDSFADEILAYQEPSFGVHGLKSLDIAYCLPHSLMDMLSHFHKVESLHLEARGSRREYRDLLATIKLIRAQDQTKLPLKDFDVNFKLKLGQRSASSIELLKLHDKLNLPLSSLGIHFGFEEGDMDGNLRNEDEDAIREILKCHSSTIKYLEFWVRVNDRHQLCNRFPFGFCLENLEVLFMPDDHFSDNLSYLRYTPKLRVLTVNLFGYDSITLSNYDNLFSNSSQLDIGDWTLASLTDLTFRAPLTACNLEKLMKWMPNMEHLRLQLDDVKFSLICKNWKNLKHLEDWGSELTDEGLIGIENANEAGGDEETRRGPNITQLKNLTLFRTHSLKVTSTSIREGFLKLANLKKLKLRIYTEIDDETEAALKRQGIELVLL